jgi:epidermal growth factor receptor substrate 15|tara:strand:+ start:382 stop:1659 length:1278 start_codon:yes stop_codon:yes gene_type:complete
MIKVYSINEILEASNNLLKSPNKNKDIFFTNNNVVYNKKKPKISMDKPFILKGAFNKKKIPADIEEIILEAEKSQIKEKITIDNSLENNQKQNLVLEDKISQKEIIEDLYTTFGKKIKKNTLQLILELRKDIIFLTKNISTLKNNKQEIEQKNKNLKNNIYDLQNLEKNLENNLNQSIKGFNSLYDNHKNLKLSFNTLEEDLFYKEKKINESAEVNKKLESKINNLDEQSNKFKENELILSSKIKKLEKHILTNSSIQDELTNHNRELEKKNIELKTKLEAVGHVDIYLQEINELKLKNKDLENTIEKLKSYEDSNDQNLNIIKEFENKIKYYQEENIRISNQLFEVNKKFGIVKNEIEVLQDQRTKLIAKINSVNDVIGNSKVITNVFQNAQPKNTQIVIDDPEIKKKVINNDINQEILNIFSK